MHVQHEESEKIQENISQNLFSRQKHHSESRQWSMKNWHDMKPKRQVDKIKACLEHSFHKPLKCLAQITNIKKIYTNNYKITEAMIIKKKSLFSTLWATWSCNSSDWHLQLVHDVEPDPQLTSLSSYLNRYQNTENFRYRSMRNPALIHYVPFHDANAGVLYVLWSRRIMVSAFHEDPIKPLHGYLNDVQLLTISTDHKHMHLEIKEQKWWKMTDW
jgi:hypothetical protein